METVYKVVKVRDGKFESLMITGKWSVTYKVGVRSIPSIGYLFAFDNIEDAKIGSLAGEVLLECNADVVKRGTIYCGPLTKDFEAFWKNPTKMYVAPRGTVLCEWIEPIRERAK